ncbi:uncharacterized protein LOC128221157 isoform X2 [Mya arenaria]|uniref:uncharacterized protein LOC128221157 isoform X2 n=1 Tax=Mya arenaria TaxID=6604 RepID=UPI0022E7D9AC|nr:uncharacterized protein LOC128221157 isoform X2 [Mya arenaria]
MPSTPLMEIEMDYNVNKEERTLNYVNSLKKGVWRGDSRSCEQRGIIYSGPTLTRPVNMNDNQSTPQPIKTTDTSTQPIQEPETVNDNQQPMENADTPANQVQTSPVKIPSNNAVIQQNDESNKSVENSNSNQPIRFNLTNSQPIRLSSSSSSDSSDHSKRTTWGQVKNTSPKKTKKDKQDIDEKESGSPHHSPTKHKNCKAMTSWKDISPSKSASSSDLEHSCHSNQSTDCTHRIFRFSSSRSLKDLNESTSSSNTDNEAQKPKDVENVNKDKEVKTCCKNECGSPCKKSGVCKCVKKCNVCCHDKQEKQISPDNQNALVNSQTSSNDNGSPKRERRDPNDDNCDNDYFYDEDFSVQFDTNLRETSVTPIESDPNTTILDFPNMVTGSYLRFNGGSSNVSFNNSKASSQNASVNTLKVSNTDNTIDLAAQYEAGQYDSENSGNSGSHVSTMEIDSSDQNMLGSSDLIDLSDGPLFTPTPSNSRNEESCDSLDGKGEGQVEKGQGEGQDSDMSGSNGSSSDTNLNVNCNTRKEEYFLSFDGSNSKVSGSETDISLSFTSHDSYQGHWMQSETSQGSHDLHCNGCHGEGHEASNEVSGSEGQEESTDSFHICFNKLSPRHKSGQYVARENLTGRVMKRLVTVKESSPEHGNSSEDENTRTSTTLTAGSKTVSSVSPQMSLKKRNLKPICQPVGKVNVEGHCHSNLAVGQKEGKPEQLYLVGIGKPLEILRKASVHSHSLPPKSKLVSWKQVKNIKNDSSKCQSLPEIPTCTSWEDIAALKCRKLADVSESFHNKRHSASLLEFYQRMKSESNPVSPDTMNNLEQILWPNFISQKVKSGELTDSSGSSQECPHCLGKLQGVELADSGTKAYTNKRIFDWLKMECSGSLKDSNRPSSLACQTCLIPECSTKETLISPQTVTLWCGTKTVGSQFPPKTKDCAIQTFVNLQNSNDNLNLNDKFMNCVKKDQALQTSDFEEEEILSILSDNFEDFNFLKSNERSAKELISCPDLKYFENDLKNKSAKIQRSKSAEGYRNPNASQPVPHEYASGVGRSRSVGRLGERSSSVSCRRRMGISKHYSQQSLPDIAFLTSSISIDKEESRDSLFDIMKLDLPYPVTIAPKTELEQFNIYKQSSGPCHHHHDNKKPSICQNSQSQPQQQLKEQQLQNIKTKCCINIAKLSLKSDPDSASSSSGISTSSASSGIDPGYCDCRSRSLESPENDLERLIFFPPHTEEKIKIAKDCCNARRKAQSVPSRLSECANANGYETKFTKYANEARPLVAKVQCQGSKGQCRISAKWISGNKNVEGEVAADNLYALEEEQTPVASPDGPVYHRDSGCYENSCHDATCNHDNSSCGLYGGGETDFTESEFYQAVENDRMIVVGNGYYAGVAMDIDSNSSSGSSIPNGDRKPLKSCLRKRNRTLRSTRSMSATDTMTLNFDDIEAKVRNHRHSYGCDEVYIVQDEHGQMMMYQADDSAEPVMFYLGKDGECHMTEGQRNHLENFGSLANFNIEAADSIHASDDSSTDKEGNGKRKSVSFASEVSIQSISPAASPRKQQTAENGSQSEADTQEVESDKQELTSDKQEVTSQKETEKEIEDTSPEKGKPLSPEAGACSLDESCQGDSSSTDSAPSEFHVTMDTNDNLWFEDVMLEKIGLLESISKASDVLVAHFATSTSTFDKLRLGNTTETPVLGDIVITRLCTAITAVLQDGLKHHLAGFQMFGSVQVTVWKVVEASVEIVPQTRSLCDLVQKVKQTSYLATHQQKFDAFVFGLLNLRVLDFWMSYLRQKEEQLAKFYNSGAILVHSPTALKKHYDDMITSLGKMSVLPFHLDMTFIKEKALTDSKFKSQEMTNSDTGMVEVAANQNADVDTPTNLTPSRSRPSMLDFSASKALNWLANATISRMQSSVDVTDSKFKTSDSTNESTDSDCSTNQVPELTNVLDDNDEVISKTIKPKYELSESQRQLYSDAKLSQLDVDPFISQNESLRSSISSATGFTSLFSTLSARLGENKSNQSRSGEQSISQSLTQSMTSSASSLMLRLTGIKLGSSQKTYKKGVTDYSFQDEITKNEPVKSENPDMKVNQSDNAENPANENEASKKAVNEEKGDKEIEVKFREKKPDAQACENRNKRVSFDIVKMFDKLLLPGSNPEGKPTQPKPVSKIPVPKNRWSWNFGITKSTSPAISENQSTLSKASTDTDLKTQQLTTTKENQSKNRGKTTDSPRRNEHFPKHGPKPASTDNKLRKGSRTSTKTTASRVSAPPKPPRLVQSETDSKKSTPVHQARNKSMATL